MPTPTYAPRWSVSAAEVRGLVRQLADVDQAGIGYSPSVSGDQFLPLARADEHGSMLLLGQPAPRQSAVLARIVEAGAAAVPVLLECIEDATPTKLPPMKALMWSAVNDEYDFNTRRTRVAPAGVNRDRPQEPVELRVTVGDLCFVALGQIVNRRFAAVRYQPSGGLVVSSPPASAPLRDAIRAEWSGLDEARLRASLVGDFEQPDNLLRFFGAAARLSYYFPEALAPLMKDALARPTYGVLAVHDHVRALYADDRAARACRFRRFVTKNGPAARDGILAVLFQDLGTQEAYEQRRIHPPTAGADLRARECLVDLYGYPPTVRAIDRPRPLYSSNADRDRLLQAIKR